MHWPSIIFWTLATPLVIALEIARRRRLAPLLNRACAGREWRDAFPDAPADEIREFLKLFVDGFALRRKHCLAFRPADWIMDVYRTIYPPKWTMADKLEVETLAQMLEEGYALSLESMWHDAITLGEIFGRTRAA